MEETRPDGTVLSWTYDAQGRVTERSTPTGTRRYRYDALGRLTQVTGLQGEVTRYAYDAAGRLQTQSYPNGVTATYRYDVNGRLTQLLHSDAAGAVLTGTAYGLAADGTRTDLHEYDGQSRVDADGRAQNPLRSTHYAYDGSGRLTEEAVTGRDGQTLRTVAYTYDKVGNRLNITETTAQSSTVIGYTYDSNDRLTQESKSVDGGPAQVTAYSWDANGRLAKKAESNRVTLYRWDSEDHLLEVKQGAAEADAQVQAQYAYDADGQRIQKLEKTAQGDKMTRYLIDATFPYAQVVEETTTLGSQTETVHYLWGLGLIAQTRAGEGSYYHADGLGSVKALSDAQGQTTDVYDYDAFGAGVDHIGGSAQPYRFAGEHYDPEAGMQYHRARWYDTGTGRFTAMDPFSGNPSRPATLHKYAYANNDPANLVDPSGLMTMGEIGAAMDIASTLAINALRNFTFDFAMDKVSELLTDSFRSGPTLPSWGGHPGGALLMSTLATMCFFNERACLLRGVPTLVNGVSMPLTSIHIADAQAGFGSNERPTPFVLSRVPPQSRNWLNSTGVCPTPRPAGLWCDEYPYSSSLQGGQLNWVAGNVSVRLVPDWEQKKQRDTLNKFYREANVDRLGIIPTSIFFNVVAPLPTFYIDRRGKKHRLP